MRITKIAFKIHGWIGLAAGFFFLLFGLTGSVLIFRKALDHPPAVTPTTHHAPLDSIYRNILHTHKDLKKIVLHDFPRNKYDCYEFMVYRNIQHYTDTYLYFIFVDPYTGRILKEGGYEQPRASFIRWLYSLHYTLLMGMPGRFLTAILGLLMLVSLLTGTIIYRKHFWQALRFKSNFKNWRTAASSLHRIIGVWTILTNTVLFLTGVLMNITVKFQLDQPQLNYEVKANIDSILQQAHFEVIAINIPVRKDQDVWVRGHMPSTSNLLLQGKASGQYFHAETGALKKTTKIENQPWKEQFDWMVYQLHIGAFGGIGVQLLYALAGIAPGILTITGAMLWWRRGLFQHRHHR
jgi:uncharacterized iron-regulated membrane protein